MCYASHPGWRSSKRQRAHAAHRIADDTGQVCRCASARTPTSRRAPTSPATVRGNSAATVRRWPDRWSGAGRALAAPERIHTDTNQRSVSIGLPGPSIGFPPARLGVASLADRARRATDRCGSGSRCRRLAFSDPQFRRRRARIAASRRASSGMAKKGMEARALRDGIRSSGSLTGSAANRQCHDIACGNRTCTRSDSMCRGWRMAFAYSRTAAPALRRPATPTVLRVGIGPSLSSSVA
jgi:hypothetical protein